MAPQTAPQKYHAVEKYEVRRDGDGVSCLYGCPICDTLLLSPLDDAGKIDECPNCKRKLLAPGVDELKEESRQQMDDERERKLAREAAAARPILDDEDQQAIINKKLQLDRDPVREWLFYVGVIGLFLIFAAGEYMSQALVTDKSYFCAVIYALFGLAFLINMRGMFRLRYEYVWAASCMRVLAAEHGMSRLSENRPVGVFHRHVMDLQQMSKAGDDFSQDSLVTLIYSRMMAESKVVEVLAGVLVSLGLIGTIVGLIDMTGGLSDALASLGQDSDTTGLLTGMRSSMAGLGTAFNTTLVGAILGSVAVRILNSVYTTNVDHLVSYVASTAEVSIIPRLKQDFRLGADDEVA